MMGEAVIFLSFAFLSLSTLKLIESLSKHFSNSSLKLALFSSLLIFPEHLIYDCRNESPVCDMLCSIVDPALLSFVRNVSVNIALSSSSDSLLA